VSVYGVILTAQCPLKTTECSFWISTFGINFTKQGQVQLDWGWKLALTWKLTALGAMKCCGGIQKKETQPPIFAGWNREVIDLPLFFDKKLSLMSGAARTTRQDHLRVKCHFVLIQKDIVRTVWILDSINDRWRKLEKTWKKNNKAVNLNNRRISPAKVTWESLDTQWQCREWHFRSVCNTTGTFRPFSPQQARQKYLRYR
jgi:hypothetical protein